MSHVPAASLTSEEDDIDVLRRHLEMPELPYLDLSAQRASAQAQARWPLFAELAGLAVERRR